MMTFVRSTRKSVFDKLNTKEAPGDVFFGGDEVGREAYLHKEKVNEILNERKSVQFS